APKGVPDYVPPTSAGFVSVRDAVTSAARRAGYGHIELPIFEDTTLFARGGGESTDVVAKEMYTFSDRGGRSVTLRTGGTAGGVGESTALHAKERYTCSDRGGRSVPLRPEGTAGVMRAVIENGLDRGQLPVKLCYAGPFFRYERPQAGRYRQLQQVGIEAIGV